MAEIVMELKNINKFFGSTQVIHDVSFQVQKGDFVTLLGPSGCGKTTILRASTSRTAAPSRSRDGRSSISRPMRGIPPWSFRSTRSFPI